MNLHRIFDLIEEHKQELFELVSSLIKINSESYGSKGGNEAELAKKNCIRYVPV